jgi:predicted nuclease with TOPRIM domain
VKDVGEVNRLLEALQSEVGELKAKVEEHDDRIDAIEKENVGTKHDLAHVVEKVDRIDANMTWLVRLLTTVVVTGVIGGAITLIFKLAFKV